MLLAIVLALVGLLLGVLLVFRHRSTKDKSMGAKVGLGLLAGIGIGVLLNAGREVAEMAGLFGRGGQMTVAEAEQYVKQQMEAQAKRKVDSIQLRSAPSGGFIGEAKIGNAVYDLKVEVRGREIGWEAKPR